MRYFARLIIIWMLFGMLVPAPWVSMPRDAHIKTPQASDHQIDPALYVDETRMDLSNYGDGSLANPYIFTYNINTLDQTDDDIYYSAMFDAITDYYVTLDTMNIILNQTTLISGNDTALLYLRDCAQFTLNNIVISSDVGQSMYNITAIKLVNCHNITIQSIAIIDPSRSNENEATSNPKYGIEMINCTDITMQNVQIENTWAGMSWFNVNQTSCTNLAINLTDASQIYHGNVSIDLVACNNINMSNIAFISHEAYHDRGMTVAQSSDISLTNLTMYATAYRGLELIDVTTFTLNDSVFNNVGVHFISCNYGNIYNNIFKNITSALVSDGTLITVNNSRHLHFYFNTLNKAFTLISFETSRFNILRSNLLTGAIDYGIFMNASTTENDVHNNIFSGSTSAKRNRINIRFSDSSGNNFWQNIIYNAEEINVAATGASSNAWSASDSPWGNWWANYTTKYGLDVPIINHYWSQPYEVLAAYDIPIYNGLELIGYVTIVNNDSYPLVTRIDDMALAFASIPDAVNHPYTQLLPTSYQWSVRSNSSYQYPTWYEVYRNETLMYHGSFDLVDYFTTHALTLQYMMAIGEYNLTCVVSNGIDTITHSIYPHVYNDAPFITIYPDIASRNLTVTISDRIHTSLVYSIILDNVTVYNNIFIPGEDPINITLIIPINTLEAGDHIVFVTVNDGLLGGSANKTVIFTIPDTTIWWIVGGITAGVVIIGIIIVILKARKAVCNGRPSFLCNVQKFVKKP